MRMVFLWCLLAAPSWAAEDVVILDDVDGKEVHVFAKNLLTAYQKYTAAKSKELKANAPLEIYGLAYSYATRELFLDAPAAEAFAKHMSELGSGKAAIEAHRSWMTFARRTLYLDAVQARRLADEKCEHPNSLEMRATYEKNYVHAKRVLYKDDTQARAFAEEMLTKVGQSGGEEPAPPVSGRRR